MLDAIALIEKHQAKGVVVDSNLLRLFKSIVEQIDEIYDSSTTLVADPVFERLGFADAAIATVCSPGGAATRCGRIELQSCPTAFVDVDREISPVTNSQTMYSQRFPQCIAFP